MTKKRTAINLDQLAHRSAIKVEAMVSELTGEAGENSHHSTWSRRFAASGKMRPLKPLRVS